MILGDCVEEMRRFASESFDVVLTDPPYSSGARREASKSVRAKVMRRAPVEWFGTDSLSTRGFAFLMRACALEWHRLLKDGGHVLCFIDWRMAATLADAIESADLRPMGLLVWDKGRIGMGTHFRLQHELVLHFAKGNPSPAQRRDVGNVLHCTPRPGDLHPTEKPVALLRKILSVVCPPGGAVLDPFAGSGATGIAARDLGQEFALIEREERYVAQWMRGALEEAPLFHQAEKHREGRA